MARSRSNPEPRAEARGATQQGTTPNASPANAKVVGPDAPEGTASKRGRRKVGHTDLENLSIGIERLIEVYKGHKALAERLNKKRPTLYAWQNAVHRQEGTLPSLPTYEDSIALGLLDWAGRGSSEIQWKGSCGSFETVSDEADCCRRWLLAAGHEPLPWLSRQIANQKLDLPPVTQKLLSLLPLVRKGASSLGTDDTRWAVAYNMSNAATGNEIQNWIERHPGTTIGFIWEFDYKNTIERLSGKQFTDFLKDAIYKWKQDANADPARMCGFILIPEGIEYDEAMKQLHNAAEDVWGKVKQGADNEGWSLYVRTVKSVKDSGSTLPLVQHVADLWFLDHVHDRLGWLLGAEDQRIHAVVSMSDVKEFRERPWAWSTGALRLSRSHIDRLLNWNGLNCESDLPLLRKRDNEKLSHGWVRIFPK